MIKYFVQSNWFQDLYSKHELKQHQILVAHFSRHAFGATPCLKIKFKSELFNNGKLVYSDDFDGELNRERWGQPKGKSIKDGKLTIVLFSKLKKRLLRF